MKRFVPVVLSVGVLGLGPLASVRCPAATSRAGTSAALPPPTLEEEAQAGLVNSKEVKTLAERAEERLKQHDYRGAVAICNQIIAALPRNATAYNFRGQAKGADGDHAGARADFDRAIALDPRYVSPYLNRSVVKKLQGDFAGAEADCRLALKINPKYAPCYTTLAYLEAKQHDYAAAEADFNRALALAPDDSSAHEGRASIHLRQGRYDDALAEANRVLARDPKAAPAYSIRGSCKRRTGDLSGAVAEYRHALALDPKDKVYARSIAYAEAEQGRYPEALADAQDATPLPQPHDEDYRQLLIWTLRRSLGQANQADQGLSSYLAARPRTADGRWPGAVGAFLLGREPEEAFLAQAATGSASETGGQRCEAWYYAGLRKLFAGDRAGAAERFRRCVGTGEQSFYEYELAQVRLRSL